MADMPTDGMESVENCAAIVGDRMRMRPALRRRLRYTSGRSTVFVQGGWYWVRRDGRTLHAVAYDNGPDYFAGGICRGISRGKVGFFNRQFQPVIVPRWNFAFPFDKGRAIVCNGCHSVQRGENAVIVGGLWGEIDRRGREVRPPTVPQDRFEPDASPGNRTAVVAR